MSNSKNTLKRMLDDFYPYAKDYLEFDKDASINFASDESNAKNPLGKTAYYDPANYSVTVYTNGRHPKDIMRSVSHELVHHTQNCRGDLNMSEHGGVGYAQNDEHLRNMEREAYEKGNLCFRDWEDGIKSNLQPGTIYEQKAHRSKNSMNDFKSLKENFNSFLQQESEAGSYKAGDKVTVAEGGSAGTVVEVMAGGEVVLELEDGSIVKAMSNELEPSGGDEPMQEAEGESPDLETLIKQFKELQNELGMTYEETAEYILSKAKEAGVIPPSVEDEGGEEDEDPMDDFNWVGSRHHYEEGKVQEYGDHETQAQGGMVSSSQSSDPELDQVADIARTVIEGGGSLHDLKQPLEAEAFDVQATNRFIIVKTTNGDIGIASAKNVELTGGEELIDTPYGQLAVGRINQGQMEEGMSGGFDVSQIQSREDKKYGGMIHMLPDIQFTGDIATDMQSAPSELLSWLHGELESGDSVQDSVGRVYAGSDVQDVVKDMPDEMFAEGFRGSPEEKEMTSKMSNKEFSDYHTRDKHLAPDLKGDMGPLDGMEGPFQFRSGAVLYYDNKAGKYYDRGKDMYIDNEEASRLTMERNQMKLKSDLREKVKASVMSKLKEMYDDDDMYGDDDPYMAGLEAEFPWMADKKKKAGAPMGDEEAAMAAAAADAAAAGEFEVAPEEEEEAPSITMKEGSLAEYGAIDAQDGNPPSKIGQGDEAYMEAYNAVLVARGEEPLPVVQPDQAYLDALQSGSMKPADHSYNMEEGEEEVSHETTLRDRVMAKVQETLAEKAETTEEHDDDPALKGDQDELPDALQKNIIDKADDEDKKEESLAEEKEECPNGCNCNEKESVAEAEVKDEEEEEEVEESVAPKAEDFFRQLRNESRVIGRPEWSQESRTKRTSVLNERLMKAWFDK